MGDALNGFDQINNINKIYDYFIPPNIEL